MRTMSENPHENRGSVELLEDGASVYESMIDFAGLVDMSVSEVIEAVKNQSPDAVFVPASDAVHQNPATEDELRACLEGQQLTMTRRQQETAYYMLQLFLNQRQTDIGLNTEEKAQFASLNSKLLDIGDELHEKRGGKKPSLTDPSTGFGDDSER